MRFSLSQLAMFAAGTGFGILLMQPGVAQQTQPPPGLRLNHVGIYAKDYHESMRFYTQVVGLKEAFTIRDQSGNPTLTYLQINRDQFVEVAPATGQRTPGLSHAGILPDELSRTVSILRQRGAKVEDPRTGATRTAITNLTDPDGVRLELLDFLPDSLPRKAMEDWK